MQLTPVERQVLEYYREYHTITPTVGLMWRRSIKRHLALVALLCIAVPLTIFLESWWLGIFFMGFIAGVILGDFGWLKRGSQNWRLLDSIIDWNKVDNLLALEGDSGSETKDGPRPPIPSPDVDKM